MARPRRRRDAGGELTLRAGGGGDTSPRFRKIDRVVPRASPFGRRTANWTETPRPPYRRYSPTTRWRHAGSTAPISSSAFWPSRDTTDASPIPPTTCTERASSSPDGYRHSTGPTRSNRQHTSTRRFLNSLRHSWTERRAVLETGKRSTNGSPIPMQPSSSRGSRKPSVAAGDFAPHRRNFLPASTSQCYRSGVRSFSPTRRARRTCRPESKSAGRFTDRRPLGG